MSPKVFSQTTNIEIKNIINDIIERVFQLTNHPKDDAQVGIEMSKSRKQRIQETRALLRRNCLRKLYKTRPRV